MKRDCPPVWIALALASLLGLACGGPKKDRSEPAKSPPKAQTLQRAMTAMGTRFEITLLADRKGADPDKAIAEAWSEIRRIDKMMSSHIVESPLSEINARAGSAYAPVPREIVEVVDLANRISALTDGKFDISFAALEGLWDYKSHPHTLPDPEAIEKRRALIDYRKILVDRKQSRIMLQEVGMKIGLGAIAKGYGVDRAAAILRQRGFNNFILYGGGDLYVAGRKLDRAWRIGIQDPRNRSRYFARIDMPADRAIVTSGDYERFFDLGGKRYHHIIDPQTGYPAEGTVSVTILAKTAVWADGLATGVFALGPDKGMALIEKLEDVEGIIVDTSLTPRVSSGLKGSAVMTPIGSDGGP